MISYGKSDTGKKRKANEDSFRISECDDWVCATVCDGMGGAHGGSVASELAVCVYSNTLFKEIGKAGSPLTGQIIKNAMLSAVEEANTAVYERAMEDDSLNGMGTTLVSGFTVGDTAYVLNVGDSRLYSIKNGFITQITRDHSYVQYLQDSGQISAEEAKEHPNRNIITKAVGISKKIEADFLVADKFDGLLLCSDGLVNYVTEDVIQDIVSDKGSVKKKVNALVSAANKNGGGDNITVVLLMQEDK